MKAESRLCLTKACRRRLPASARASLTLPAAPDAQRSASGVVSDSAKGVLEGSMHPVLSCLYDPIIQECGHRRHLQWETDQGARSTCPQSLWKVATRKLDQL